MSIVGGLDIHRSQVTFDVLDAATGEVARGQVRPADREHLRRWLARFAGQDGHLAMEGGTGWRYVAGEVAAAGLVPHVADPAELAAHRGRKRHAKTDRADARFIREQLQDGRLPECWVPPPRILEYRALLELYHDLREDHTAWVQRIQAVLFHQGAPRIGEGLGTAAGRARLAAAAACLSPAGQQQVAVALQVTGVLEEQLGRLRRQLVHAARHLTGARELQARIYGAGPVTALALTCWLGGAGRFSSARKAVRFAGPGHHRLLLRPQGPARTAVPAGTAGAALGGLRGRQDPRPVHRPRPRLLRAGQGRQRRQARSPVRGPQDPPAGLPHPDRARRRRAHRRLRPLAIMTSP
jgi:transposase